MAFDLTCPDDLSLLRIVGTDSDVRWSEIVDHAGGVDKDGGGSEPVSTFVTEVVEDAIYKILKDVQFGDGSNSLTFKSLNEMVYFDDGKYPTVKSAATLQLGELQGDWGINGSMWSFGPSANIEMIAAGQTTAKLYCYSSTLQNRTAYQISFRDGDIDIRNSTLSGSFNGSALSRFTFYATINNLILNKVYFVNTYAPYIYLTADIFKDVHSHYSNRGLTAYDNMTADGLLATSYTSKHVYCGSGKTVILKDPKTNLGTVQNGGADSIIIEQYTCNIHVADKDGADLAGVDIDCECAHLVEGSDSKTYKCIQNHTAVDATHKPITGTNWNEYWELYDTGGGLGGDWNTGFDYKAGTIEFATVTTDANGNIPEQVINYKQWVGTSEVLEVRIHKFTFAHAGYPDFVMNDVIIDHPLIWEFDMGQSTSDLTSIVQGVIETNSLDKAAKLLVNKAVQNKSTGAINYYDDDGQTVILTHTPTDGESEITRTPS